MTDQSQVHRADIDGLRAVAVIPVIFYHALPKMLPGGFIGVDIFFVISGFLISRNILQELDARTFSIAGFYGRRVRRIFPALAIVLFAALAYGFVILLPSELAQLGKDVVGGASFLSNILLWQEAGYFDRAAVFKPLLHLWSLGVEEQFYIFWPLFLIVISRWNINRYRSILVVTLCSFAVNVFLSRHNIDEDFYSPLTRLWELSCGGALAYLSLHAPAARISVPLGQKMSASAGGALLSASAREQSRFNDRLGWAALAVIVLSCALMNQKMTFPGWWAAFPVLATAAIIYVGPQSAMNRTILSSRVATAIGLISYPLYLWHWPLLSFTYILRDGRPLKILPALGILAISVALAWLTYAVIEKHFRFKMNRRLSVTILVVAISVAGVAGATAWVRDGFAGRYASGPRLNVAKLNAAAEDGIFKATKDMVKLQTGDIEITKIGSGTGQVLFVGDSVVYQYGPRVQELYDEGRLDKTVFFVVGRACPPVPDIKKPYPFEHCARFLKSVDEVIRDNHIDTIVLGSLWALNRGTGVLVFDGEDYVPVDDDRATGLFYVQLQKEVESLIKRNIKVYLILSPPANNGRFDPRTMVARSPFGFKLNQDALAGVPMSELRTAVADANGRLEQVARNTGATTLDPFPDVCGTGDTCSAFFNGDDPKYTDITHLRPSFVAKHITFFDGLLTQGGAAPAEQK